LGSVLRSQPTTSFIFSPRNTVFIRTPAGACAQFFLFKRDRRKRTHRFQRLELWLDGFNALSAPSSASSRSALCNGLITVLQWIQVRKSHEASITWRSTVCSPLGTTSNQCRPAKPASSPDSSKLKTTLRPGVYSDTQ